MKQTIKSFQPNLIALIKQATAYMLKQDYADSTIRQYVRVWKHFLSYAESHGYDVFTIELASKFMKDFYGIKNIRKPASMKERWRIRFIWCLDDFRKNKCFAPYHAYNVTPIPDAFAKAYFLYEKFLKKKKQCPRSISSKLSRIKIFLFFCTKIIYKKQQKFLPRH